MERQKELQHFIVNASLIFKESITVCFLFIFMFVANFKIVTALLFLMMFLTTIIFFKSIANKIRDVGIKVRINSEKILQKLTEAILSIKIIKLTDKNDFLFKMYLKKWQKNKTTKLFLDW